MKAPSRAPESMQLKQVSLIRKRKRTEIVWTGRHVILVRLGAIIIRKCAILPTIIQGQKTNLSLNDFLVDSWSQYRGHLAGVRLGTLHSLPGLVQEQ